MYSSSKVGKFIKSSAQKDLGRGSLYKVKLASSYRTIENYTHDRIQHISFIVFRNK
jgi:hypothetical protein